ncbi:alpha/beta hydrolase [Leucobacter celer]|uniref:alpha/beta hydrolase n=1 Tax=Leucobacter celer TaxID=668625 RepID=UPI0006A7CC95|nr:alpha/beta hydrolase [Leucobacter celer]
MSGPSFSAVSIPDIAYREIDGARLHLDLHRPETSEPAPVVVYFHGGAWEVGERTDLLKTRMLPLVRRGIAVASVEYRLTGAAAFPAQLLDARAAVAWLRGRGGEFGLLTERIGAWGSSAGGHLAALLGLESPLAADGGPGAVPHAPLVSAVAAWNAPLDLDARCSRSWLEEAEDPAARGSEAALLGAPAYDPCNPRHRAANPIALVTAAAAPMQFVTGDRDRMVDPAESFRMHDALVRERVESAVAVVGGAGHEDLALDEAPTIDFTAAFFRRHLLGERERGGA